jgi:hypothetical protein
MSAQDMHFKRIAMIKSSKKQKLIAISSTVLLAFSGSLALSIHFLFETSSGQNFLSQNIQNYLQKHDLEINGKIKINQKGVYSFDSLVFLTHKKPIVSFHNVKFSLKPWALLYGCFRIHKAEASLIHVEDPVLLKSFQKLSLPFLPVKVKVDHLRIENLKVNHKETLPIQLLSKGSFNFLSEDLKAKVVAKHEPTKSASMANIHIGFKTNYASFKVAFIDPQSQLLKTISPHAKAYPAALVMKSKGALKALPINLKVRVDQTFDYQGTHKLFLTSEPYLLSAGALKLNKLTKILPLLSDNLFKTTSKIFFNENKELKIQHFMLKNKISESYFEGKATLNNMDIKGRISIQNPLAALFKMPGTGNLEMLLSAKGPLTSPHIQLDNDIKHHSPQLEAEGNLTLKALPTQKSGYEIQASGKMNNLSLSFLNQTIKYSDIMLNADSFLSFDKGLMSLKNLTLNHETFDAQAQGDFSKDHVESQIHYHFEKFPSLPLFISLPQGFSGDLSLKKETNKNVPCYHFDHQTSLQNASWGPLKTDLLILKTTFKLDFGGDLIEPLFLKADFQGSQDPLTFEGHLDSKEDNLHLINCVLGQNTNTLKFNGQYGIHNHLIEGTLNSSIQNFAPYASLLGYESGEGTINGQLIFKCPRGEQDISGNLKFYNLNLQQSDEITHTLKNALFIGQVQDLFGKRILDVKATAFDGHFDNYYLASLSLNALGEKEKTEGHLKLKLKKPLLLETESRFTLSHMKDFLQLKVDQLWGKIDTQKIFSPKPFHLTLKDQELTINNLLLKTSSGLISAHGSLTPHFMSGKFHLENFPLESIKLIHPHFSYIGDISAEVDVKGSPKTPQFTGSIFLDHFQPLIEEDQEKKWPEINLSLKTQFKDQRLSLEGNIVSDEEPPFNLQAKLPLDLQFSPLNIHFPQQKPFEAELKGPLDCDIFQTLFALQDDVIQGKLDLNLKGSGTYKTPSFIGTATLEKGNYENHFSGLALNSIKASLTSDGKKLKLDDFKALDHRTGFLSASGECKLHENFETNLDLDLDHMNLIHQDNANFTFSGKLKTKGSLLKLLKIDGSLLINKGSLTLPEELSDEEMDEEFFKTIHDEKPIEIIPLQEIDSDKKENLISFKPIHLISNIMLNINMIAEHPVKIQGWGLKSEWNGEVSVHGPLLNPHGKGGLTLLNGEFNLLGPLFKIQRGIIQFEDQDLMNPTLDLKGKAETSQLEATLRVSGTAKTPLLSLTSTPERSMDDLLETFLVQKGAQKLSPFQAYTLTRILSRSPAECNFEFLNSFEKISGLDSLEAKQEALKPINAQELE